MQPKNVMLLGFVNKAVEYLDQNLEDPSNTKLASLKHLDLVKLKKELSDNLDASLGIMQSTMTSLLNAGSDAFNEFLTSDDDHETLVQQMAKEFDFNFDEESNDKNDLNELLSFYNLDKKFEDANELPQVEDVALKTTKQDSKIEEEVKPIIMQEEVSSQETDETKAADLDDESLELMRLIQDNVNKVNNGSFENYDIPKEEDEINEIFSEIELNDSSDADFEDLLNNIDDEVVLESAAQQTEDNLVTEKKLNEVFNTFVNQLTQNYQHANEVKHYLNLQEFVAENNLQNNIIYSIVNVVYPETIKVAEEEIPVETLVENVEQPISETPSFSDDLINQLRAQMIKEDTENALNAERELQDSIIQSVLEASYYFDENNLENEIIDSVIANETVQEEVQDNEYLESLLDDLKSQMFKEDQERLARQKDKEDAFAKLKASYPMLSDGFISSVYDLKQEIADEYKDIDEVILLHRVHFENVDDLRQFAEIVLSHNYQVNVDEKKLIVDVFKEFKNVDGKILSNIFEIANQAAVVHGDYEGYRVITN